MGLPGDLFGRPCQAPREADREGRIALLAEAADALLAQRLPSAEACLFLGAALSGFLANGHAGELERKFLRIHKQGSRAYHRP